MSHLSNVWFKVTGLQVTHGRGCRVTTTSGDEYLDFAAGIAVNSTGHAHPRVAAAIAAQAERFIHAQINVFTHDLAEPLASKLDEITPAGIDTFFFANSGAEITEAAVKLAKQATRRPNVIVFQGSFHGRTHMAMAMTTSKTGYRAGHAPLPAGVYVSPFPDPLADDQEATVAAALTAFDRLLLAETAPTETAAVIMEPVLGEGGYVPAPKAFIEGIAARCKQHGILFIADEVQSGFGRTGNWFAVEQYDIEPDIICMAKGIASGFPFSALGTRTRARRPLAEGQSRRHLRRQPARMCGGAGDDRGDERARFHGQRAGARRAAQQRLARAVRELPEPGAGARAGPDGRHGVRRSGTRPQAARALPQRGPSDPDERRDLRQRRAMDAAAGRHGGRDRRGRAGVHQRTQGHGLNERDGHATTRRRAVRAWRDLQSIVPEIERRIDDDLRAEWAVPLGWFDVLATLRQLDGRARPQDVASAMRIPASSLSRRLDRLEEEGWVRRHRDVDPEDHRAVEVELTRRGRALWREMNVSYRRSLQARFAVVLDDDDIETLATTMRVLSNSFGDPVAD